jgi:SAM-dependent methyltransferase
MPEGWDDSVAAPWDDYVAEYHDANPGITEDLLARARDDAGRSPYDWVVEALPARASPVVDLACGSGPLARTLGTTRVVGVDRSAGELARAPGVRVRADATALPLAGDSAAAVVSSMALMLLHPLEAVLAEVARVLRRGGAFVATVPSRGAPAFGEILRALDQVGVQYPEPLESSGLASRFSTSGLTLASDEVAVFNRPVAGPDDAAQVVRSFYAPGAGAARVAAAIERFQRAAPAEVSYRLRRLVARR